MPEFPAVSVLQKISSTLILIIVVVIHTFIRGICFHYTWIYIMVSKLCMPGHSGQTLVPWLSQGLVRSCDDPTETRKSLRRILQGHPEGPWPQKLSQPNGQSPAWIANLIQRNHSTVDTRSPAVSAGARDRRGAARLQFERRQRLGQPA